MDTERQEYVNEENEIKGALMEEEGEEKAGSKKGKKESNASKSKEANSSKHKVALDFKDFPWVFELLQEILEKANQKKYGRKVEVMDLVKRGLEKLDDEDISLLQNLTYSKLDKVHLAHELYNETHGTNLSFDDFLLQELKIQ